jgi:thioredoxin reductase (NADPH)
VELIVAFTGAKPNTDWLPVAVDRDDEGYIVTKEYQTSVRGIFAVGDVRSGAIRRVANAVGEGAAVVSHIHKYLRATDAIQDMPQVRRD